MYPRYHPPSKLTSAVAAPSKHLHFSDDDTGRGVNVLDEPPKKKTKLSTTGNFEGGISDGESKGLAESTQSRTNDNEEVSTAIIDKSAKKDKKKKKSRSKKDDETMTATAENEPTDKIDLVEEAQETGEGVVIDGPASSTIKTSDQKKEKRKKKKPEKEDANNDEHAPSIDDETQKRHRGVLEKKQRSTKAPELTETGSPEDQDIQMEDVPPVEEVHGLEPLPQPGPVVSDASKPAYETLPSWLAEPIRVSRQASSPFTELGLGPEYGITSDVASKLAKKGYEKAFAIQTAVLPQLLPHHCRTMHSDILVSAATGSGKTLSYVLPVIRDVSRGSRWITRLRAVIVLPTRELVRQVRQICEDCADAFADEGKGKRVSVGIAMGSRQLQKEQEALIAKYERYDPEAYEQRQRRIERRRNNPYDDPGEWANNTEDEEILEIRRREDEIPTLSDNAICYKSKVDALICTPGRLVEHIKFTPGFTLEYVRWLVVDEADKLLAQDFQQWLDVVIPKLRLKNPYDVLDPQNFTRKHNESPCVGVRKVILSATMTRDLDLLRRLELRRPKLVILEGVGNNDDLDEAGKAVAENTLPEFLSESAVKADRNLKPLYLLDLLQSSHILGFAPKDKDMTDDASSSDSDTDSDSESEEEKDTRVLIFTNSNESALRLSRLLSLLSPALATVLDTLTSTTPYAERKKTMKAFSMGKLRIIVASDLASRGIDLPSLDHVINYDMPRSVTAYVHRVGRTARAGKGGHAWTLFTDSDAGWFWQEVAKTEAIRRGGKVERVRITEKSDPAFEERTIKYEQALEALGKEAREMKRRGR